MLSYEEGKVIEILSDFTDATWIKVDINGKKEKAINYKSISGEILKGDVVVLNTTAVELSLGTGGQHFVIYNKSNNTKKLSGKGHIMKLRYTPNQMKFLSVEEEDSPYHDNFNNFRSLENHPVILGTLHSMLGPIVSMLKYRNKDLKISYIMTDTGALPIGFSNTVRDLKEKKLIENTITIGQAFGGDYEAVNLYTGLITSKEILESDITIVTMGPGIVGTGTKYGFSGIEQGTNIDIVNTLGGRPFVVPRIGFKDTRERHNGLSHHTITVLSEVSKTKSKLVLPNLEDEKMNIINKQIKENHIDVKHFVDYETGDKIVEALDEFGLNTTTMGRGIKDDKEFFLALGAVGEYITKSLL